MKAGAGDSDDVVSRGHVASIYNFISIDGSHGKAGKVKFTAGVKGRHLGRLPSQKGAVDFRQRSGDSGDYLFSYVRFKFSRRKIVEKEERLRPATDQVVDAHGDQVLAHRVEPVEPAQPAQPVEFFHFKGEFQ